MVLRTVQRFRNGEKVEDIVAFGNVIVPSVQEENAEIEQDECPAMQKHEINVN